MKIRELLEILSKKDPESEVWLDAWNKAGDRAVAPLESVDEGINPKDKGVTYLVSER